MFCLKSIKIKFFALSLALLAISSFAGEGNMNYYGQLGVHKTQSAQTLGHGRFGIGMFLEGAGLGSILEDERFCNSQGTCAQMTDYLGANGYPFISIGLSNYFDFSIGIPIYGEYLRIEDKFSETDNLSAGGWGDVFISSKIRAPFDEKTPIDLAVLLGFGIGTGRSELNSVNGYGPWIRNPMFLVVKEDEPIIGGSSSAYTTSNSFLKFGAAATLDFGRMKAEVPVLFHVNYSYRMILGSEGSNYANVQSISAALEWTPVKYISLFGEFYNEMPTKWPANGSSTDLSTVSFGTSFHLSDKVDLQMGAQIFVGDESKYIEDLSVSLGTSGDRAYYNARLIPKYMVFGGLTFKIFTIEEEYEEEEEEYRNPDTDEDGVCDPWVSETGRQREFARICKGIDLCPYEAGPIENKGCPIEEVEAEGPTVWFTVNQDLVQRGQSVTLNWRTTNATEVTIEGVGTVEASGSRKVRPTENTIYTLTATGEGGTQTSSVEVEVSSGPVPTILFTVSSDVVQKGQSVTLTWQTNNATEVSIDGDVVKASGTKKVKPTESTVYTLTAVGEGGTQTSSVEVEIVAGPVPTIMFSINKESIQVGQIATLSWQTTNAKEVSIDGDIGVVQTKGTKQVKPTESTVYTLTATGEGGTQTATVEIEVTEPPPIEKKVNLKGVNFLSGKSELTLDAKRVLDGVAEQLIAAPDVKIEIHGHTDNVGKPASNQDLSERRAKAVIGYLATKGVKMSRMSSVGFGQDVPIADNKTAEGRELNRRIEMIRVDD